MKAICIGQAGNPDSLALMNVPVPAIDDDEVLVRVKAIGVGLHDRWFIPRIADYPYVIGIEAAGIIEKMGPAVAGSLIIPIREYSRPKSSCHSGGGLVGTRMPGIAGNFISLTA